MSNGARKALGTATAALEAGDAGKARRALAFAASAVGMRGCPQVPDLAMALRLVEVQVVYSEERREAELARRRAYL